MAADFTLDVELDTTGILRQILEIGRRLDEVVGRIKPIVLSADTTKAEAQLKALGAKTVSPKVELNAGNAAVVLDKQLDAAAKEARQLQSALIAVDKEIDQVNNKPVSLSDGLLGGLVGGGVAGLVSGAAQQIVSAFSFVIEAGSEFETALQSVSAVTGVTGAGLDDIGERAQGLAAKFGGSSTEQLGVFQTALSKIGPQLAQSSTDLTTFADNVNTLSKTDAALGAAGAVDALSGALLQFGVNVNDTAEVAAESTRFMNVLAASAGVGSASVAQVAEAIGVVGSSAANANVTFEETNAALQVLASKALVGSQAGTALTAVINKLQAAPGPAGEKLKELGTSSQKLGQLLTTKGIGAAMDELRGAMGKLGSDAEKNAFLVQLFGETGLNAAAALLGGGDKLKEFTKGVTGTQAAVDQAAINMNTFSERMSRLKAVSINVAQDVFAGVSSVVATIGNVIGEVVDNLKPLFDEIFENFKEMYETLKPIYALLGGAVVGVAIALFGQLTLAIRVVTDVVSTLYSRISEALMPIFDKLGASFKSSGGSALTLSGVLEVFAGVLTFVGDTAGAIGALLIEFLVSPIEQIVGVVTSLMSVFGGATDEMQKTGQTAQKTGGIFDKVAEVLKNIPNYVNGVTAAFRELKEIVADAFEILGNIRFDNISEQFSKLFDLFGGADERVSKSFGEGFSQNAKKAAEKAATDRVEAEKKKQAELEKEKQAMTAETADKEKKERTDLSDKILAAERGLRDAKNKLVTAGIADEKEAELAAAADAKQKRLEQIADQIKDAQKLENVSKEQKDKLLEILNERYEFEKKSDAEVDAVRGKYAEKELARQRKLTEDLQKNELAGAQAKLDLLTQTESRTVGVEEAAAQQRLTVQRLRGEEEVRAFIEGTQAFKAAEAAVNVEIKAGRIDTAEALKQLDEARAAITERIKTGADIESLLFSSLRGKQLADEAKVRLDNEAAIQDAKIRAIQNADERERETSINAARRQYAEELRLAGDNENLKYLAFKKFKEAQVAAEEAYLRRTRTLTEQSVETLLTNLQQTLSEAFTPDKSAADDIKNQLSDIEKAEKDLYKARAANSISFEDFQKQLGDLAKQEAELKSKLADMGFSIGDAFSKAFGAALGGVSETMAQTALKMQTESLGLYKVVDNSDKEATAKKEARFKDFGVSVTATAEEIAAKRLTLSGKDLEAYDNLTAEITTLEENRAKAAEDASSKATDAYTAMAIGVGTTFAQMAVEGKHNIGEFVLFALDGLMKLVPVIVAEIFGQALGQLGPIGGAVASAGITAAFMGLVSVAKSAVLSGYKTGGYTGDIPADAPAGVVHGKEFVFTAGITEQHRPLFEFIHRGGNPADYYKPKQLYFDSPDVQFAGRYAEIQRLHGEITVQRTEIDRRVETLLHDLPELHRRGGNEELLAEVRAMRGEIAELKSVTRESAAEYRAHTAVSVEIQHDETLIAKKAKQAAVKNILRG